MKHVLRIAVLAVMACAIVPSVSADPRSDALAILRPAIEAHGGKDALLRAATFQRISSGELYHPTNKSTFSDVMVARLPDHYRIAVELERGVKITTVLNGKAGWKSLAGSNIELPNETVNELREEGYVQWIATLAPLLSDEFTLTPAGEADRSDKKCVGIKVVRKGNYDAVLWFDKESKLLVAIDKETKEGGQVLRKRYHFTNHKEFYGVRLPTKLAERINDRLVTEVVVKEIKLLDRVDDANFARP